MERKRVEFDVPWPSKPFTWLIGSLKGWLPSKGNILFTLLVVAGLFWAQSAGAIPLGAPAVQGTSTNTIAYQGRLADSTGNPITAVVPMVFRLYNAASGGTPLWEENWTGANSVNVSDGLFNVMLGSVTQIPQAVVTGNSSLWLGITVNADNEMAPRVQLGTVPFAVQALTVPDGSVTAAKQTVSTYDASDLTAVTLKNTTAEVVLSEFSFPNAPAGDVTVMATLSGYSAASAPPATIRLFVNGTKVATEGTHGFANTFTQIVVHGRYANYSGGTLVVRLVAYPDAAATNLVFGYTNDERLGRKVTVVAGQ